MALANRLTPAELADAVTAGETLLLDVRTPAEYGTARIPGSINVPVDLIEKNATAIGAGINRTLLAKISDKILFLNKEQGLTFCLIEHDLDYVSKLCDEVIVMAQGTLLTRGSVDDVRQDARVIEAYFGGGKYEAQS